MSDSFKLDFLVFLHGLSATLWTDCSILGTYRPGEFIFQGVHHPGESYLFAFSYCSWGSQDKNTEEVCHSLLQWTTFCQNCDAFQLWCWKRLLRVPWTARRSNQSILKEISPECSSKGLMLKLKLQYFDRLMWRADSFEKTLMLGKIEGGGEGDDRGWDGWMASPTQ